MEEYPASESSLRDRLIALRRARKENKEANRRPRSQRLRPPERATVLSKTGGRCHICGGPIVGNRWNADHVLPHSAGGSHSVDNYLPAHGTCNNYRWDYLAAEFEVIMKLGVWARTQVEKRTNVGRLIEERFSGHEAKRVNRRKSDTTDAGV